MTKLNKTFNKKAKGSSVTKVGKKSCKKAQTNNRTKKTNKPASVKSSQSPLHRINVPEGVNKSNYISKAKAFKQKYQSADKQLIKIIDEWEMRLKNAKTSEERKQIDNDMLNKIKPIENVSDLNYEKYYNTMTVFSNLPEWQKKRNFYSKNGLL